MTESPTILNLHFLGHRDYLHGSTLFDALIPWLPHDGKIVFKITGLIRSDRVEVRQISSGETRPHNVTASLAWSRAQETGTLGIWMLPPSQSVRREASDESLALGRAKFAARQVSIDPPFPHNFSAMTISLNKALVAQESRGDERGRWMFTRLDLDWPLDLTAPLMLRIRQLSPAQGAKTTVWSRQKHIGDLYFSWVKHAIQAI